MNVQVRCDEVRELLPELAEPGPRPAGPVEGHLAGCARCSAELAVYHDLLTSLANTRELEIEPPPEYLDRTLRAVRFGMWTSRVPSLTDLRRASTWVGTTLARAPRTGYALASLGGAAVGATAIALVWWRVAKRAVGAIAET
jgi:hypothetical protein